jgi:tRNA1Val (adenine37-N6)-methyltransferase
MKVTTDACLFGAWVAEEVRSQGGEVRNILDVGAGTGLLSLMLAQKNPGAVVDAIEIDQAAAKQAEENIKASPWKECITVINADARSFSFSKKYYAIISNPPFYEKEIKSAAEKKNIAHHSEQFSFKELLTIIKDNITGNGVFFLLFPYKRNEEIKKLFRDYQLHISKILFVRQSVKHDFFRIMIMGKLNGNPEEETEIDEISIWNESEKYTPEFISLLKDYYLYL